MEKEPTPQIEKPEDKIMSFIEYDEIKHPTPYIYKITIGGRELTYFGTSHVKSSEDPILEQIEKTFREDKPDLVFVEGREILRRRKKEALDTYKKTDRQTVISWGGEPDLLIKLAAEAGVEVDSPEPKRSDEIIYLQKQGFDRTAIFAFFVFRGMSAFCSKNLDSEKALESWINRFKADANWDDFDYSVENLMKIGKSIWGDFDIQGSRYRFTPSKKEVGDKWTVSNEIAQNSTIFRDKQIICEIQRSLDKYSKILVVYGASHAVMQEPAIRAMLGAEK